ncbi:MAG: hypothetical protein QG584_2762 [Pseudomonadota bacterium]|nr:hypothetical protein [Pseudomonadota bacterium]MDQ5918957.1 hypothetical protein [Pseudomonadota bacterium]MDQ5944778.1 hypothetical protein [Pseudomonadota bacterium]
MSHSLDRFLANTDAAGSVMAHARLLQKLARIYENSAPEHLGKASRVANYKSGTVVIHADNGAVAVKLRQMAPTLANEFSKRGVECNGVTVKVQAIEISQHFQSPTGHTLPAGAGRALAELAAGMPASPLREAIETLLERSAKAE